MLAVIKPWPLEDAHAALDTAALTAYGFSAKKDLLSEWLEWMLRIIRRRIIFRRLSAFARRVVARFNS